MEASADDFLLMAGGAASEDAIVASALEIIVAVQRKSVQALAVASRKDVDLYAIQEAVDDLVNSVYELESLLAEPEEF